MKKFILLISLTFFVVGSHAQVLLNETFSTLTDKLAVQPGDPPANADNPTVHVWYQSGKTADSNSASIAVDPEPLYCLDYINSGEGKSALIDWGGDGGNTRVDVIRFIDHDSKIKDEGNFLYYAFMMHVDNIQSTSAGVDGYDWRDVLCITEGGNNVLGNSFRGRFFLQQDPEQEGMYNYTISKNSNFNQSSPPDAMGTVALGQTYLFVIKQTFTGDNTCKVEVMHNAPVEAEEPTEGWINGKISDTNTFGGTYGVALRRRNLGSEAKVLIGGLRIAKTYAEAVGLATGIFNVRDSYNIHLADNTIVTGAMGKLTVYSMSGSELVSTNTDGRYNINLQAGNYIVRFIDNHGVVSSTKIQIN